MRDSNFRRFYMDVVVYRGDVPENIGNNRVFERMQTAVTDDSEFNARKRVLENAWTGGLLVEAISITRVKNM